MRTNCLEKSMNKRRETEVKKDLRIISQLGESIRRNKKIIRLTELIIRELIHYDNSINNIID